MQSKNKHLTSSKRRRRNYVIIVAVLVAVLLGGFVATYAFINLRQSPSSTPEGTTNKTDDKPITQEDKDRDIEEEPSEPIANPEATLGFSNLSQSDGKIHIAVTGKNVPEKGRCIIYFSSEAEKVVSKYLTVQPTENGVECLLDISENEFTYLGKWKARVTYTSLDNKIIETESEIVVR